ncbi:hypothetical protein E4T66_17305 [Sinimarinibacterium sp. CAU 1509]|uniref:hypothetical protein n=1 Tax=Sinimarinibacterium sp. CAU 1509 TaxID=2562283 RepID=UPI0010AC91D3|nr:hypothetical protein [Sinimarinibacterium sp. CAU 1509]TJY57168.1 hypothetical protein E4T66_17305 [Sinimarinibacterium sp. CAU 1509]
MRKQTTPMLPAPHDVCLARSPFDPRVDRRPLNPGNQYAFFGYPGIGFRVTSVCLRGHPADDGALPGVGIQWLRGRNRGRWFYPCATEDEFWADTRFANACDPEAAARHAAALAQVAGGSASDVVIGDRT